MNSGIVSGIVSGEHKMTSLWSQISKHVIKVDDELTPVQLEEKLLIEQAINDSLTRRLSEEKQRRKLEDRALFTVAFISCVVLFLVFSLEWIQSGCSF